MIGGGFVQLRQNKAAIGRLCLTSRVYKEVQCRNGAQCSGGGRVGRSRCVGLWCHSVPPHGSDGTGAVAAATLILNN